MKKHIFILFIINILTTYSLFACDICGCGVGSYYVGIMPQFQKHFVGIRYKNASFRSHLLYSPVLQTEENFQSTELWARIYPLPKMQVLAFVPYNFNAQRTNTNYLTANGLGDITLLANYNLFKTVDSLKTVWKHNVLVGGGVKLPTGKYEYNTRPDEVANPNFQLGTGSMDFLLSLTYTLRYQKAGINTDLNYKINTQNSDQYRFGNKVSGSLSGFYITDFGKNLFKRLVLMPNAGVYWEHSQTDTRSAKNIQETGGYLVNANIGLETYYTTWAFGLSYQTPLSQNLAQGQIRSADRLVLHLTKMF